MAINYTVTNTFSPNTTIASAQVNTNFSDNANTWTGLEALTKTFAKLKVDVDPATALEVATKQYVDHYSAYRRPVLQYSSGTVVIIESIVNGVSGPATVVFPDGNQRSDSTASHLACDLTRLAALSGVAQSGIRTGTVAANTWYAIYAVKTSDNSANFVAVADVVLPINSNFATLNANFGTNSWVYIGMIRNGDNESATTAICKFVQAGNYTRLINVAVGGKGVLISGTMLATTAAAASLTYTYSAGTGATNIPDHLTFCEYLIDQSNVANDTYVSDAAVTYHVWRASTSGRLGVIVRMAAADGVAVTFVTGNAGSNIMLVGWIDNVLGVGSNPIF